MRSANQGRCVFCYESAFFGCKSLILKELVRDTGFPHATLAREKTAARAKIGRKN